MCKTEKNQGELLEANTRRCHVVVTRCCISPFADAQEYLTPAPLDVEGEQYEATFDIECEEEG